MRLDDATMDEKPFASVESGHCFGHALLRVLHFILRGSRSRHIRRRRARWNLDLQTIMNYSALCFEWRLLGAETNGR